MQVMIEGGSYVPPPPPPATPQSVAATLEGGVPSAQAKYNPAHVPDGNDIVTLATPLPCA
jgi:hypothetical protein